MSTPENKPNNPNGRHKGLRLFDSGLNMQDVPGVSLQWRFNPDTQNYDLVGKQEPDDRVDEGEIASKLT